MTPLTGYLLLSAFLFAIGLAGALTRRNAIIVLIGIELMLNAANDPFLPHSALPRRGEVSSSVTLEVSPEGGHVGFVSGAFPGHIRWLPSRVLEWFEEFVPASSRLNCR